MAKKNKAILIGVVGLAIAIAIGFMVLIFADLGSSGSNENGAPAFEGLKLSLNTLTNFLYISTKVVMPILRLSMGISFSLCLRAKKLQRI